MSQQRECWAGLPLHLLELLWGAPIMVDTTAPRYHNGKLKSDYNSPWQPGCADIIFPYCYFVDILHCQFNILIRYNILQKYVFQTPTILHYIDNR